MNIKKCAVAGKPAPVRRRVLIIDDHVVVRQGLMHLINLEKDFLVCGEAEDARTGMDAISRLKPDAVIVDISLQGMNGVEFIKNARTFHPGLRIVVLSMHDESLYAERVLRAGALGYVMKSAASGEIITALRKALKGELHTSSRAGAILMQKFLGRQHPKKGASVDVLSDRELEIFELIGRGRTSREIAGELTISIKTVDSHRMHIKGKLNVRSAPELVQHAVVYVENSAAG